MNNLPSLIEWANQHQTPLKEMNNKLTQEYMQQRLLPQNRLFRDFDITTDLFHLTGLDYPLSELKDIQHLCISHGMMDSAEIDVTAANSVNLHFSGFHFTSRQWLNLLDSMYRMGFERGTYGFEYVLQTSDTTAPIAFWFVDERNVALWDKVEDMRDDTAAPLKGVKTAAEGTGIARHYSRINALLRKAIIEPAARKEIILEDMILRMQTETMKAPSNRLPSLFGLIPRRHQPSASCWNAAVHEASIKLRNWFPCVRIFVNMPDLTESEQRILGLCR